VVLVGAGLRFATLGTQSLWFDEAVTAHLLRMDLGAMLRAIPDSESTPPLYYVVAWLWTHLLGTGEVGLRSLSAVFGSATIWVAWALGRRLGGDRAGLAAAALTAFNPMLVWFSQEARSYALLALLGALSALLWLRALEQPRAAGRLVVWGVVAALAMATHYYAIFLVAPQGLWLLIRAPGMRERAIAVALPVAAAAALAPLAISQRANDGAAFIGGTALLTRIVQIPKQFLVGYDAPLEVGLVAISGLVVLGGLAGLRLLVRRPIGNSPEAAADAIRLAAVTAAALVLPIVSALAGEDHLITRNVVAALPLTCVLVGAGLAAFAGSASARERAAALAVATACLAGTITTVAVARDPQLQRDDWRAAVRALGPIDGPRLIVVTPSSGLIPLRYYLPALRTARPPTFTTAEIDYVALPVRLPGERPKPPRPAHPRSPAAGYALVGRTDGATFTVLRWRSTAAQAEPIAPSPGLDGTDAALLTVGASPASR
jgi:4-amino-4-deoxy-L-arabinose transferase-like glycosyltransferase